MPFKIVETIEDNEICLSIVPSAWEEKGILRWPKKKGDGVKLSKQETSVPQKNWLLMKCRLKRLLHSYEEAENELQIMEGTTDTDIEQTTASIPVQRQFTKFTKDCLLASNFNAAVPQSMIRTLAPPPEPSPEQSEDEPHSSYLPLITINSQNINDNVELTQQLQNVGGDETTYFIEDLPQAENNEIENIQKQNEEILSNQKQIIKQLAAVQTALECIPELITKNAGSSKNTQNKENLKMSLEPINSVEELSEIEEKLKVEDFKEKIVHSMKYICGTSGKLHGRNCCYKLIDYFITRDFLKKCSWTGNSKNGTDTGKVPLKFYKNFRECFRDIIIFADKDFTDTECDTFFKTILKNSKIRAESTKGILSKSKKRPSNLIYKKNKNRTETMAKGETNINEQDENEGDDERNDEPSGRNDTDCFLGNYNQISKLLN